MPTYIGCAVMGGRIIGSAPSRRKADTGVLPRKEIAQSRGAAEDSRSVRQSPRVWQNGLSPNLPILLKNPNTTPEQNV